MVNHDFCINSNKAIPSEYNTNQFYFIPHPMLRKYISHYTLSYSTSTYNEMDNLLTQDLTVIPDGSGCLIYGFDNWRTYEICWGPTSKPVKVKRNNLSKNERQFFIEFLPGGLNFFTGIDQKVLKDLQCTIVDVNKNLSFVIRNIIESSKSIDDLIQKVDKALLSLIENNNKKQLSISSAIYKIKLTGGTTSIKSLAKSEYISERHLRRLFEKEIGLSVKMFTRITRLNEAINLYRNSKNRSTLYIAQQVGFFDESHFIRDFKELCGTTPQCFVKNMSDFYNEPFKY